MIILDENGGQLELSKTRLTEITGYVDSPYSVSLKEWITKPDSFNIQTEFGYSFHHPAHEGGLSIGCRHFSEEVYGQIVSAAKLAARKKPKTAKARKKSKRKQPCSKS